MDPRQPERGGNHNSGDQLHQHEFHLRQLRQAQALQVVNPEVRNLFKNAADEHSATMLTSSSSYNASTTTTDPPGLRDDVFLRRVSDTATPLAVMQHPSSSSGGSTTMTSSTNSDTNADTTNQPGSHDVLLGRGGETNSHSGNIKFRQLVNEYKESYKEASKIEKPAVARRLVAHWRGLSPRGRFLAKTRGPNNMVWRDVGDKNAQKRASKSLGEREKPSKRPRAPSPGATLDAPLVAWGAAGDVDLQDQKMPPASAAGTMTSQSSSLRAMALGLPIAGATTSFIPVGSNAAPSSNSAQSRSSSQTQETDAAGTGGENNLSRNDAYQEDDLNNTCNNDAQQSLIKQMIPTAADLVSSVFTSSSSSSSISSNN